jgi:His/Glu/Gln/Arg/opine family amino acid ABC transporter permease subunit
MRRHGEPGPVEAATTAPDTRGTSSPFSISVFVLGTVSMSLATIGLVVVQAYYALWGATTVSQACIDRGIIPYTPETATSPASGSQGALGVCHIVEGLTSSIQTTIWIVAIALGVVSIVLGWGFYRRMDTRRRRDQMIAGAVLGLQGAISGGLLLVFASGQPQKPVSQYFNIQALSGYGSTILTGMRITLFLAIGSELLGIVVGLLLSLLTISKRRGVRAPARVYINLFRGTPLLVQLSFGYFGINLGLGLHTGTLTVALIILGLNAGAYLAEVFRAGIQSIERGQMEAARSVGMTYLQAMRFAIVPQAIRRVIPPLLNEFVVLIKDTSLVTILGETLGHFELFAAAQSGYSSTFSATFFVAAAIGYLIITLPMIGIVTVVERRLRSGLVTVTQGGA